MDVLVLYSKVRDAPMDELSSKPAQGPKPSAVANCCDWTTAAMTSGGDAS